MKCLVFCTSPCTALSPLTRGPALDSIRAGTVTLRVECLMGGGRWSYAVYRMQDPMFSVVLRVCNVHLLKLDAVGPIDNRPSTN